MANRTTKAYIALTFVCIIWGTTYLALRIGVAHYPAFLYAAIRQVIAGTIIMLIGWGMNRKVDLSKSNLLHQALIGFLLITAGNGLVSWGERYVSSGIAALICSLMPICAVLINISYSKAEKLNLPIVGGMIMGIGGIAIIFKDNLSDFTNRSYLVGMIAIFIATCTWSLGSVINKRRTNQINPIFNSGMQLLWGGLFLFMASPLMDSYKEEMNLFHPDVLWTLIYLITLGSVLAYTAYIYALKELPVGIASLYAYINPLVAVILGYLILDERLTWYTGLAFVVIMIGLYLVNFGYKKQK